ncbi:MAG: Fe2+-dependent dioxygenase [Halioglobus sp.]|nr:Fe2+-dependent dioxygenase [Halioglobus sp.]
MLITIERVLSDSDLLHIATHLEGARWRDGRETAAGPAQQVKHNLQLDPDSTAMAAIRSVVLRRLQASVLFQSAALPRHIFPPLVNCHRDGGEYGLHTDSAVMTLGDGTPMRSDLSATVFLTAPQDYSGGDLVIESSFGAQSIKLEAGDMVLYPSSSLHCVNPVVSGSRIAACFWVQSLLADAQQREQLFELDQAIQSLTQERGLQCPQVQRLTAVYHNLVRMWAAP